MCGVVWYGSKRWAIWLVRVHASARRLPIVSPRYPQRNEVITRPKGSIAYTIRQKKLYRQLLRGKWLVWSTGTHRKYTSDITRMIPVRGPPQVLKEGNGHYQVAG